MSLAKLKIYVFSNPSDSFGHWGFYLKNMGIWQRWYVHNEKFKRKK